VAGRLAWDPRSDERALIEEFLTLMFGPARVPMKRMLERWSEGFCLTSHELALSYRDIEEAGRLAKGHPEVEGRVADYGRYVEYTCAVTSNTFRQQPMPGRPPPRDCWNICGTFTIPR
jgi:hypothetical protein